MRARARALRAALPDHWLEGYRRQAHITVALCGFPVRSPRHPDDFGPATLAAHLRALRDVQVGPRSVRPFTILIGAPDTFREAAYLSVYDLDGGIGRLRAALGPHTAPLEEGAPYIPHVTIGLYRGTFPIDEVRSRLNQAWRIPAPRSPTRSPEEASADPASTGDAVSGSASAGRQSTDDAVSGSASAGRQSTDDAVSGAIRMSIARLHWMTYESAVIGGPLTTRLTFDLRNGEVEGPGFVAGAGT